MGIKLTQSEADALIDMLKKTVEYEILFPQSKGRVDFTAIGSNESKEFLINISRKGINARGASYQGRIRSGADAILLRLDVNPTSVHINPDGEKIIGSHLHVFRENFDMRFAESFDVNNNDLYRLCLSFFERFNIIEPPLLIA